MNFENLPQLGIVLRGALKIPQGYTREEFIKDFIANTAKQDGMDQERSVIAKYFPRGKISASQIPYVSDVKIFNDTRRLMKSDFADAIRSMVKQWKSFPPKRALTGAGLMDGDAIARLVKQLFDTMNTNSWLDFGSAYITLEREVCAKSFDEFVRPVLSGSADEIDASFEKVMAKFAETCALKEEVEAARKELLAVKEKARELEVKETKLAEEKVKRERADEERKLAEEKHVKEKAEKEEEIRQEKTRREEVVKENDQLKDKIEDLSKQMTNPPPGGQNDLAQFVGGVVGGLAAVALSDQRLKQDIISSPHSEYDTIGLTGVGWKWSKAAQQQFDLAGEGRGVIAQEVEKLYPFAVTTGKDGYKRVNYKALEFMMKRARQGEKRACLESLPDKDKP